MFVNEPPEKECHSNAVSVLPVGPFNQNFSYLSDVILKIGDVVEIPFGNKKIMGVVAEGEIKSDIKLKKISKIFEYNIGCYYHFLEWVASYTLIPKGYVLKMILAEKSVFNDGKECRIACQQIADVSEKIELNEEQELAYNAIIDNGKNPSLLHGVTGSGKTEIYLSVSQDIIKKNKQVLILLPEIVLMNQISDRIEKYFGFKPLIWNSNITPRKRKHIWMNVISGEACVVIGTRSALFLPFKNLGLIVVDEEHDSSYKQEEMGFYNARDMSIVLGNILAIPVILSSATPSLESHVNAMSGKYGYVSVKNRFGISQLAPVELIDMRQFDHFLSPQLLNEIKKNLEKKEQCLVYMNRRGYSPITLCKFCGDKISCPNCTFWLVYHKNMDKFLCHYCGYKISSPKVCSGCGQEDPYIQFGPGVEKIFEELSLKFPEAKIEIASSDTMNSEKNISQFLEKIRNNDVNIIVCTQILAKGHHFPNITLVGIIDGDFGLSGADLRASEKTYQLISQVSGRAGRAEKFGRIFIQTFKPDHSLWLALKANREEAFIDSEISAREKNNLPPFTKFASIIISGTNGELAEKTAKQLANNFPQGKIKLFGPAPAQIFLLRGRSRWRILLKSSKNFSISIFMAQWLEAQSIPRNIKVDIDIDPVNFL
jgi:primosomal protein N' (replication factor Y)